MNRNGYAYFTADPERAARLERTAREISALGAGELRVHRGAMSDPIFPEAPYDKLDPSIGGADLLLDPQTIRCRYPFLESGDAGGAPATRAAAGSRRSSSACGCSSRRATAGVELVEGRLTAVAVESGRVTRRRGRPSGRQRRPHRDRHAGQRRRPARARRRPALPALELPLVNELHGKVYLDDAEQVVPRELPLMIWCDPVTLDWGDEERAELAAEPELAYLTRPLPGGVHFRPGGRPRRAGCSCCSSPTTSTP